MSRIIIVGGGLSGFCLAQRMLREGWNVLVVEKDESHDIRGQGYRLTIDRTGALALRACLSQQAHEFIRRTTKVPSEGGGFSFLDCKARQLFRFSTGQVPADVSSIIGQADRQTLREGLLIGLNGRVQFGKILSDYEITSNEVVAFFSDGSNARADILVGADGIHSKVREMRLPGAEPVEIGISAIFGRTSLKGLSLGLLQSKLAKDGLLALGPRGINLFCTAMRFPEQPAAVSSELGIKLNAGFREDYIMWGVTGRFPIDRVNPAEMRELALEQIRDFHGEFKELLQAAKPNETIVTPLRASPKLHAWESSKVTLIGDAIHTMPPFGANGANTALRDAQLLGNCLVDRSKASIEERIGDYEHEMLIYGQKAVKRSVGMMKMTTTPSPLLRMFLRGVLRLMALF